MAAKTTEIEDTRCSIMNPDSEFDVTVYEDIKHLSELWRRDDVSNSDIRNSSHILRRLLIYNDLQKSANSRKSRLTINVGLDDQK